jgi:hypothetical protein
LVVVRAYSIGELVKVTGSVRTRFLFALKVELIQGIERRSGKRLPVPALGQVLNVTSITHIRETVALNGI